jgi:hypothetical protein
VFDFFFFGINICIDLLKYDNISKFFLSSIYFEKKSFAKISFISNKSNEYLMKIDWNLAAFTKNKSNPMITFQSNEGSKLKLSKYAIKRSCGCNKIKFIKSCPILNYIIISNIKWVLFTVALASRARNF